MIAQQRIGKNVWLLVHALVACSLQTLPARGQAPIAEPGEIKVVVRISKQMIDNVASREEIKPIIPWHARIVSFHCEGVIEGRATLSVEMIPHEREGNFLVKSQGTAHTCARGVRGPIAVTAPVHAAFTSQTLVRFDGRKFTRVSTTPCVNVHIELERVEGSHGGAAGRAAGKVLYPLGQLLVPRAERQALPVAEYYLTNYVDDLAAEIIRELNATTPVEESMNRLFPETRDWAVQLSAAGRFIQAAYGPRDGLVPPLPENPGRLKNLRLEFWLHSTTKGASALQELSQQPLARALVQKYLEATLPELAALTEERSVEAVGSWLVISIGAPRAK